MAKIKQPFKIAFYVRVSTEEQAVNPEGSIKNQEERLRQAVAYKNSFNNFGEIKGVYVDPGISAKDMKRPKLQELLRAIRAKEIDLVMVTELSRLSRNTRDFIEMWDLMRAHGCQFTSLREDFDTTTAAGEMVLFQLMNLAQFERKQTSERISASIAIRSARGLYNGGSVPLGYRIIPDKPGYLELDPDMEKVVKAAFMALLKEGSIAAAALWLNDQGYVLKKAKQGGGKNSRMGFFTVDNLHQILRNKVYIGVKTYNYQGEIKEVKAVWPAIIDECTFIRVGKILDKNRHRLKRHTSGRMPYLLTGIAHCKTCGNHMAGKTATGGSGKVGYYEHGWATKRDSTLSKKMFKCDPHRVPSKKIDPVVLQKIEQFMTGKDFSKRLFEKVREKYQQDPKRKDRDRTKAKIYGISSQIEALSERLAELPKAVSAVPIYKQMERLQTAKSEQEALLMRLNSERRSSFDRIVALETFESFSLEYGHLLKTDEDINRKKQMIQKVVKRVDLGVDTFKIHYIVDKEHYERELALKKAGSRFFSDFSSNSLTNGDPGKN